MITVKLIREYMCDESPEDNPAQMDLIWKDSEILAAMRSVAIAYNAIEPLVEEVTADNLPDLEAWAYSGVAAELCRKRLIKLRNRDIVYEAGNVKASYTANLIKHVEGMYKEYSDDFMKAAQARKLRINLNAAYGHWS